MGEALWRTGGFSWSLRVLFIPLNVFKKCSEESMDRIRLPDLAKPGCGSGLEKPGTGSGLKRP
jgi:hypothetical protein